MELATQTLLALGLIPLGVFIYRYWRPRAWLQTYQGRTLMAQELAWFLLLLHFFVKSIVDYPGHQIVEIVVISLCIFLFWGSLVGLLLAQGALEGFFAWGRNLRGKIPLPFKKVSRKRGTGYVADADIEKTRPPK